MFNLIFFNVKYLTKFADKNTALEFTTGGRVLKAPHVSKVGNDAVFSENIERGKSCIFVEESDGELKLVEPVEAFVTFTAEEDNSSIRLKKLSTNQTLQYSTDTTTWNKFDTTTISISLNKGDKVYVRGVLNADNTLYDYTNFGMTGIIAASGNCNAIWNYQDLNASLKDYCGYALFSGCTSLTTAPELPATELAEECYRFMFEDCALTTAPELPAIELTSYCYAYMFRRCRLLITAPELPATTLADDCYNQMFMGCTSLTQAPELPATTLAGWCYDSMFYGCSNLNYIKCLATDISARDCTSGWVEGVAETGTFVKAVDTSWSTGVNGIPEGWTVENAEL